MHDGEFSGGPVVKNSPLQCRLSHSGSAQASHCRGFSCCGAQALGMQTSAVMIHVAGGMEQDSMRFHHTT